MAITWKGRVASFAAASDTIAGKVRVSAIYVVAGATGGAVVVNVGGTSGNIIITDPGTAGTTSVYTWSEPQELDDIFYKTAGTNVTIVVFTC